MRLGVEPLKRADCPTEASRSPNEDLCLQRRIGKRESVDTEEAQ